MKFFRKKNTRPSEAKPFSVKPEPSGFYSHHAGDTPLDEYSDSVGIRQTYRTSKHSPARRRENSNRASSWAIFWLLFRAALIIVLLVLGFVLLRWVLDRAAEPSEKEQQQWAANAAVMEKQSAPDSAPDAPAVSRELVISPELIGQRLMQWEQTERHFRSAEALNRRGIDDEAVTELGQALRATPDNRAAQMLLVDIYIKKGFFAEAVPLCVRLLDQDSRPKELLMKLLTALQASGQTEAGLLLAEQILQTQPNNLTVLSIAAAGKLKQGDQDAALALFGRMIANDAKNTTALEGCGKIYSDRGDFEKAVPYYLDLIKADAKPEYYQALARCYARQNEAGKTVVCMGQAASLFGSAAVVPWLRDTVFDPVRETAEFRSFADHLVGAETRKAIEALNKREAEKASPEAPDGGLDLPKASDLQMIRPGK